MFNYPGSGVGPYVQTLGGQFAGDAVVSRVPGARRGPRRLLHPTKVAFDAEYVVGEYRRGVADAVELVEVLRDVLEDCDGGRRPPVDALAFTMNTGTPADGGGWLVVFKVAAPFAAVVRVTKTLAEAGQPAGEWKYQIERTGGRTLSRRAPPEPEAPFPYPPDAPGVVRHIDM